MKVSRSFVIACTLGLTLTSAAAIVASSFLGASAGVGAPFQTVVLPEVSLPSHVSPTVSVLPLPGLATAYLVPIHPFTSPNPWSPSQDQLLFGNTVITSEAQMRDVWRRVFDEPFDPALFDFDADVVIWMGGGRLTLGSFEISAVERVEASYADPMLPFGFDSIDPFLSVTSTTVLPGILPFPTPEPAYRVSAVRISKADFDDPVFHRALIALP